MTLWITTEVPEGCGGDVDTGRHGFGEGMTGEVELVSVHYLVLWTTQEIVLWIPSRD